MTIIHFNRRKKDVLQHLYKHVSQAKQIMCISIKHTLKEDLKNIQTQSKRILQEQQREWKSLEETFGQIEVRRTHDQHVFILFGNI